MYFLRNGNTYGHILVDRINIKVPSTPAWNDEYRPIYWLRSFDFKWASDIPFENHIPCFLLAYMAEISSSLFVVKNSFFFWKPITYRWWLIWITSLELCPTELKASPRTLGHRHRAHWITFKCNPRRNNAGSGNKRNIGKNRKIIGGSFSV